MKNTKSSLELFQNKSLFTKCQAKSVNIYIMFKHRVWGGGGRTHKQPVLYQNNTTHADKKGGGVSG